MKVKSNGNVKSDNNPLIDCHKIYLNTGSVSLFLTYLRFGAAFDARRKMEKESSAVWAAGEFRSFPIFRLAAKGAPKGQRLRGRLSLPSLFGETKKEGSRRSTTGRQTQKTYAV